MQAKDMENVFSEFNQRHWQNVKQDEERRKAYHRLRNKARDKAARERKRKAKEQAESTL